MHTGVPAAGGCCAGMGAGTQGCGQTGREGTPIGLMVAPSSLRILIGRHWAAALVGRAHCFSLPGCAWLPSQLCLHFCPLCRFLEAVLFFLPVNEGSVQRVWPHLCNWERRLFTARVAGRGGSSFLAPSPPSKTAVLSRSTRARLAVARLLCAPGLCAAPRR